MKFSKLSLLAFIAPLVAALTLSDPPSDITSGGVVTIKWTATQDDPGLFSLELTNPNFRNAFAIASNVDTSLLTITLTLPAVNPGGDYSFEAVDISNITNVYSSTSTFFIGGPVSSSSSTTGSVSGTVSVSGTTASTQIGTATTANSLPATSPTSSGTTPASASSSSTGTSSAASTTSSSSAAVSPRLSLTNVGNYAVVLLSTIAGAAAIAL